MELEFDVKIDASTLYDYMLHHTFTGSAGILGTTVGALGVVAFFMNGYLLYLIFGLILLAYQPVSLYLRAKRQALNPVFKEPLHYKMTEEGVWVSQGETEQFQKWDDMYKAVSTNKSLILYTSRVNASIFPRKDLGAKQVDVISMISRHMSPKKVQIRM
ncbi:MAG: YcxB family protein [Lachnospiraceae bacterium]|nr:YcxB family protein [Lachnospiraceae bacterium]